MSNYNSTQWGYIFPATPPQTELKPYEQSGKVRTAYAAYSTPVAGLTAGDNLYVCKLPQGARVLNLEALVPAGFVTSAAKVGYGTVAADGTVTVVDDDRWGTGIDLSAVGRKQFLITPADMDYVTTSEVAVVLNFTTGNPAGSKDIAILVQYVVE